MNPLFDVTVTFTAVPQDNNGGDYLGSGILGKVHAQQFFTKLSERLNSLLPMPATEMGRAQLNNMIRDQFHELESYGCILMIADGLRIIGGELAKTDMRRHTNVRFLSAFFPRPRFTCPTGNYAALGFFEAYDLWLGYQPPLPPTLIARYSDVPSEYLSANPTLLTAEQLAQSGEWAIEAAARAQHLMLI